MASFKIIRYLVPEKILKAFIICRFGGRFGHVTWTDYANVRSFFAGMLHMKFDSDLLSCLIGEGA